MMVSRTCVIPAPLDGERFDLAAAKSFPELSRKRIKAVIDAGGAYLNKKRMQMAGRPVRTGDRLELFWEEHTEAQGGFRAREAEALAQRISDCIIFSCEGYIVINKPAGVASQATLASSTDTILHGLAVAFPTEYPVSNLYLVHRLDKDTSGVMLIARTPEWQRRIEEVFRDKRASKTYEALCFGEPRTSSGSITYPLAPDRSRKNAWQAVFGTRKVEGMKSAHTDFTVLSSFSRAEASHIECRPRTGRTHQIRVHLGAVGCPLLGDRTYANNIVGHPCGQIALRHMLHARRLKIEIPGGLGGEWEAPLPDDFIRCLETLRQRDVGDK